MFEDFDFPSNSPWILMNTFNGSKYVVLPGVFGRSTIQFVFAYPVVRVTVRVSGSTCGHSRGKNVLMMVLAVAFGSRPSWLFFEIVTGMVVQDAILLV